MDAPDHPLLSAWRRLAARARAVDGAPAGSRTAAAARATVAGWGVVRLAVTAPLTPLLGAAVFGAAWRNTVWTRSLIERFPRTVDRAMRGEAPEQPDLPGRSLRVGRRPAAGRYLITSDLHRCTAGGLDWPGSQGTIPLYEAMLRHHASEGWTLIENGDIEDFWLTGGSAYGVTYDLARLAANLLPASSRRAVLPELYGDHLDQILEHNRSTRDLIEDAFGGGRYLRLVGNHDDPYLDERVVDRLRRHHPDVPVLDLLVLDGPDAPVGVVCHGNQTDAWNLPGRDFLGKYCTWLASALIDAPFLDATPGIPDLEGSAALREGRATDRLMAVGRRFGVTRDFFSLDEVALLDSWRRWWGGGPGPGTDEGPLLVMGHTHVPLVDPVVPGAPEASWPGYANSGCGVLWETVTAIEWDGGADPSAPEIRLVVWRYAHPGDDAGAVITRIGDRDVVREVLSRPPGSSRLEAVGRPAATGPTTGA